MKLLIKIALTGVGLTILMWLAIMTPMAAQATTATFCGPTSEAGGACEFGVEQKVFLNEEHDQTTGSGTVGIKGPVLLFSVDSGATDGFVDTGGGFANITAANADHKTFGSFNG